jgi:hypothetical protein
MADMTKVLVLALVLAACGGDDDDGGGGAGTCTYRGMTYALGDTFPEGDGCNSCSCTNEGVGCTIIFCGPDGDAGVDADPLSCGASGGCPDGPVCGSICCGRGERCDNGTCRCGMNDACGSGDSCEAAGPLGGDACGSICCGASGPCPQ